MFDPVIADRLNALFEAGGCLFIGKSIIKLWHDKKVRGFAWEQVAFWSAWGYWNIYYYWAVGSAWSWWAGVLVTIANSIYLAMLIYYVRTEERMVDQWKC